MPINILRVRQADRKNEEVDWLCDGEYELDTQIAALEEWLQANASLAPDKYIADIGYSVRKGALGGGGVFTLEMMQTLVAIGMEVYFSEYPWADD